MIKGELVPMLLAAAALLLYPPAAVAEEEPDDAGIAQAVERQIVADPAIDASRMDVTVADGVVSLDGSVPSLLAADRARRVAGTVRGVRAVVDRLEVRAPEVADDSLQQSVRWALLRDPVVETWELEATVEDGVATLTGTVESHQERMLAERVASGVRGLTAVRNDITVDPESDRRDVEVREEVERILRWNAYVDAGRIGVEVRDGQVVLSGTVGSLAEKTRARELAWVPGVRAVSASDLEVASDPAAEAQRTLPRPDPGDEAVRDAVWDALLYDPRVEVANVDVSVDDGYVTLRGIVDNLRAKRSAASDARNVFGAWAVENLLRARPEDLPDSTVRSEVVQALSEDPYVERFELSVMVDDGRVYLNGQVDSWYDRARADDVAARQSGVAGVSNFIEVADRAGTPYQDPLVDDWMVYEQEWPAGDTDRPPVMSDWRIERSVRDRILWSPFVKLSDVDVVVEDGIATLTGSVETRAEREAAARAALQGGAAAVDNDLYVEGAPEGYGG